VTGLLVNHSGRNHLLSGSQPSICPYICDSSPGREQTVRHHSKTGYWNSRAFYSGFSRPWWFFFAVVPFFSRGFYRRVQANGFIKGGLPQEHA